ncbi:MAG: carboxylesterase family protein [Bacteroidales bacterium]|nr:carboxylesterase family protein [Bacteroidales bacterium]
MRLQHYLLSAMAVFFVSCQQAKLTDAVVDVEGGTIQGYHADGLTIFKGIPFAAPPVGDLRWKAPQPVQPWDSILNTTKYATGPIQGEPSADYSEDCLYLNVWTPAKSADEKLPVLVWIYGGGFVFGNTADPNNDCEALARSTDGLILASINYRVGQLGFLSLPELSAENAEHVSGNYGLLDQIAGLQWIKNNIAKFGGDPDKITIFGESAGGISVSMLCASPLAKGLISGAISQSGGSFGPTRPTNYPGENMQTLAQAEADGVKLMESLGASSLEELRAMDASKFAARGLGGNSWPVVDGYVIPDDQSVLYAEGKYNDVPVLIGYNSDEGLSFNFGPAGPEYYTMSTKARYGQFADALLEAYPYTDEDAGRQSRDLMRDAAFGWQTWNWARLQSQTGKSKVFLYYFDEHPDYPEGDKNFGHGSYHGQDVNFVFQHMDSFERPDVDKPLSVAMGKYWTNFAKTGDPNGEGVPEWPAFTCDSPQAMHLTGPTPFVGPVASENALKVLDGYFTWRRTEEGKAWAK